MFPLLPHPLVHTHGRHTYVLPSECLKHFLAFGHKGSLFNQLIPSLACGTSPTTIRGTEIAQSSHSVNPKGDHLSLSALVWSDDCDPQNSKTNKHGLWAQTMHILQDTYDNRDSPIATFPLVLGPKEADHHSIMRIILKDPKSLKQTVLSFLGRDAPPSLVTLLVYAFLGDQPKQRL